MESLFGIVSMCSFTYIMSTNAFEVIIKLCGDVKTFKELCTMTYLIKAWDLGEVEVVVEYHI